MTAVAAEAMVALATPRRDVPSEGGRVAEFMEMIGTPLYPWQREFLDLAMELDGAGRPARSTVGLVVPRQNGKTWLAVARLLYGGFSEPGKTLVYTAQSYSVASEVLRLLDSMIHNSALKEYVRRVKFSHGDESVVFKNGSRIVLRTRTRQNARGLSGDVVILDEALEMRDPDFMRNLSPLVTARPAHQIWYLSSPGDVGSYELLALRERALRAVAHPGSDPRLAYVEFGAPEGMRADDREAWGLANPSLGECISEQTLEDQLLRLGADRFSVEHLGRWKGASVDTLVAPGVWAAAVDSSAAVPAGARPWLGLDISPAGADAALVAVYEDGDGRLLLSPVKQWLEPDHGMVAADVAGIVARTRAVGVAYDPWTAKLVAEDLERRGGVELESVTGQRFANGCSMFAKLVATRGLVHPGDEWLTAHVQSAVRTDVQDGAFRISRRKSDQSITAAMASVHAVVFARGKQPVQPAAWVAF